MPRPTSFYERVCDGENQTLNLFLKGSVSFANPNPFGQAKLVPNGPLFATLTLPFKNKFRFGFCYHRHVNSSIRDYTSLKLTLPSTNSVCLGYFCHHILIYPSALYKKSIKHPPIACQGPSTRDNSFGRPHPHCFARIGPYNTKVGLKELYNLHD